MSLEQMQPASHKLLEGLITPNPPSIKSPWGYHVGPIINVNRGWIPPRMVEWLATKDLQPRVPKPALKVDDAKDAPAPPDSLSKWNSNICWVVIDNFGTVCGEVIMSQPSYRRHLRTEHPGCVLETDRLNMTTAEIAAGQNAVRYFVFSGGWRDMRFAKEPDLDIKLHACQGKPGNPGKQIFFLLKTCDEFERAAEQDPVFARKYGTTFHRAQRSMVLRHRSNPITIIDADSDHNVNDNDETVAPGPSTAREEEEPTLPRIDTSRNSRGGRGTGRRASHPNPRSSVVKSREAASSPTITARTRTSARRNARTRMEDLTVD